MNVDYKRRKPLSLLFLFAIIFLMAAASVFMFLLRPQATQAAWFDDSYKYRLKISFTHNADISAERAVTYSLDTAEIIAAGLMQSNCADTRFTDVDGKLLKYQLTGTCNNAATTYEMVFPKIVNGTNIGYVYYNNSVAVSASTSVSGITALTPSGGDPSSTAPTASDEQGPAPVTAWRFDEGQGTAASDSNLGTANNGVISGATWRTTGNCVAENCLQFDGSNDYVLKVYASDTELDPGTGSMTVTAWFKHTSNLTGTDTLVGRFATGGYKIYTSSSGFCFGIDNDGTSFPSDSTCDTTNTYADSKWHFMSAVKNGTTSITLYIDGKQVGTPDTSITLSSISGSSPVFVVGDEVASAATTPWDGFIDEVKYYNFAKTAAQITADYAARATTDGVSAVLGQQDQEYLTEGLVGYWKMDESTTTTAADSSGNGNNLTDGGVGSTSQTGAKFSYGMDVESSDGLGSSRYKYIADNAVLSITGDLTISAWVKPESISTDHIIAAKWDGGEYGWAIYQNQGFLTFDVRNAAQGNTATQKTNSSVLSAGTWYHLVAVYASSNQTVKLYLNGTESPSTTTNTIPSSIVDSTARFQLGVSNSTSGFYGPYDGIIDETRLYNRALSPAEVASLYSWAPGPVAHWKLDENTGTSANDSSGNSSTGTITAGTGKFAAGKFGSGYSFDNANTIINAQSVATLDNLPATGMSLATWIYPKSQGESSAGVIMAKNVGTTPSAGWLLQFAGTNALTFTVDGSTDLVRTTSNSVVTTNAWNHVEVVWDGVITTASSVHIYVNGIEVTYATTTNGASRVDDGTSNFYIGNDSTQARTFDGIIDDARVYNYSRTSKQIIEDMNAGHPAGGSPISSPIIYWKLDEQQGTLTNNSNPQQSSLTSTTSGTVWKLVDSCKVNGCLYFDTNSDSSSAGDVSFVDGLAAMTISYWINPDAISATRRSIISKNNYVDPSTFDKNFLVVTDPSVGDEIEVHIADTVTEANDTNYFTTSGLDIAASTWQHVTIVYDSSLAAASRVKVYKNGKAVSGSVTGTIPSDGLTSGSTSNLALGSDQGQQFLSALGKLDEVKIYNYALTQSEILVDANAGSSIALGGVLGTQNDEEFSLPAPVARWTLDDNTGNSALDTSGNGNTGTLFAGTAYTSGKINSGVNFDGTNDYVMVPDNNSLDISGSYTTEAWINPDTLPAASTLRVIVSKTGDPDLDTAGTQANYSMGLDQGLGGAGQGLLCSFEDSSHVDYSVVYRTTLTTSEWSHMICTFNDSANTFTMYLNGVSVAQSSVAGTPATNAKDLYFGLSNVAEPYSLEAYFDGRIDGVKVYSAAMSQSQVAYAFNRGAPQHWYKFDECQGATAYNAAVTGNNAPAGDNGTIRFGASGNTSVGSCGSGTGTEMWNDGTTGKYNSALGFDGTDDYVDMGDISEYKSITAFSAEAWVTTNTLAGGEDNLRYIFGKEGDNSAATEFMMRLDTSNDRFEFYAGGSGYVGATTGTKLTIATGTWYHLMGVYDGSNVNLYVNGVLYDTQAKTGATGTTTQAFRVGNNHRTSLPNERHWDGLIDNVRLYNYPLTAAQVKRAYNEGSAVRFGPQTGSP